MTKEIALFLLFFSLIFLIPGCRGNREQDKDEIPDKKRNNPAVLTLFIAEKTSFKWSSGNPVTKKIAEKTGIILDVEYAKGTRLPEILIMLADRTYPDLIYAKGAQNKFIDAGVFLPLDDLIETHGPNIKKLYGKYLKKLRYSLDNPSIYFLGSFPINDQDWDSEGGFMLQLEVVKELGYPRLKTLEDFENAIRQYKQKYPEINGNPTIGLSLIADDWLFLISVTNPAFYSTGAPDDGEFYVDPVTYRAILHHRRPVEREYFRWLNHMNAEGLLDPESFIQTYDQYITKLSSGRVLAIIDQVWNIQQIETKLGKKDMINRFYGSFPITLSREYKHSLNYPVAYTSRWGIGITDKCVDPVAAIKFFDYLCSDEGQILTHWGIEGIHYSIDGNGKRFFTPRQMHLREESDYKTKTGINLYSYPFPEYGRGVQDSTGQFFVPAWKEDIRNGYSPFEKDVLNAYGVEYWKDLFPPEEEFTVRPYGVAWQIDLPAQSEAQLIKDQCGKITRKRIIRAILASPGDFDAVWDTMLKELIEAGVEKLEEEFTKMIRERIELWGSTLLIK
ncbi:MAG: ABC transporter substrate-binding protein [Spirochaetales bacterium]|nr:ABC transporter substrate-binding protein [Spirochaetales bacterium]